MALPEMDEAAEVAIESFKDQFSEEEAVRFATWWKDNYMKAGHKRLGRGLVAIAKEAAAV